MNVLLIGSGGREHALAWKLKQSARLNQLYCAPGNPGIGKLAKLVTLECSDHPAVVQFCQQHTIDLVVIGPEGPLVAGLVDHLNQHQIKAFGPTKYAAQLEGSKGFTKDICAQYHIPTAAYARFKALPAALEYLNAQGAPIVIKADGLAAGKGVTVAQTIAEAELALRDIFSGQFGEAACVIEACLTGEEASLFFLTDGESIIPLSSAQDHKRVGEGDTGANTGGMGAYSPAPIVTDAIENDVLERIIKPTLQAMRERGHPFKGVLYAGLMLTADGPQLIEYNVRFGDPETQVLMPRLQADLLEIFMATVEGRLAGISPQWSSKAALTVVMAAKGYPGQYVKNTKINGLDKISDPEVQVFHAGTALDEGQIVSLGGRVLNVTALASTIAQAQKHAYSAVAEIDWPEGFYRRDIGWRAV